MDRNSHAQSAGCNNDSSKRSSCIDRENVNSHPNSYQDRPTWSYIPNFSVQGLETTKAGEAGNAALLHSVKLGRILAQCGDKERRQVRGVDALREACLDKAGRRQDRRDVAVVFKQTAVLSNLLLRVGVDDAVLRLDDNVRHTLVGTRNAEARGGQVPARQDVVNLQRGLVGRELRCGSSRVLGAVEPDERNVVGSDLCNRLLDRRREAGGADGTEQRWVDGRIAVLASKRDESVVVDMLSLQLGDNGADSRVDRVERLKDLGGRRVARGREVTATDGFLGDVEGLVVGAVERRGLGERALRVSRSGTVEPGEDSVGVQAVVCDGAGHTGCNCRVLWEVTSRQTFAAGAADEVVGGVLVGVSRLQTVRLNDLKGGVGAQVLMRIDRLAVAVLERERQLGRVDARVQLGRIAVNGLVVDDCLTSDDYEHEYIWQNSPEVPRGPLQAEPGGKRR